MKNGKSATPLTCALKPFIFELRASAEAFVDRLFDSIGESVPLISLESVPKDVKFCSCCFEIQVSQEEVVSKVIEALNLGDNAQR